MPSNFKKSGCKACEKDFVCQQASTATLCGRCRRVLASAESLDLLAMLITEQKGGLAKTSSITECLPSCIAEGLRARENEMRENIDRMEFLAELGKEHLKSVAHGRIF